MYTNIPRGFHVFFLQFLCYTDMEVKPRKMLMLVLMELMPAWNPINGRIFNHKYEMKMTESGMTWRAAGDWNGSIYCYKIKVECLNCASQIKLAA